MYSLTIHFGPNAVVWSFLFKEKEKAFQNHLDISAALNRDVPGTLILQDDFGQHVTIVLSQVHGIMFEDMEAVMEARIFRSLENARGEIKAKQRAATDPVIRSAQQGPSVLQPRFNG